MPDEVREALEVLARFCVEQDRCCECPMKEFCGKLPNEYDLI